MVSVKDSGASARRFWLRRLYRLQPLVLGLRGRVVLLVLIALLPMLVLFIVHTRQERGWLLEEAENRALLIARSWNEHNGEYLDEANVLLRLVDDVNPSGADCEQKLGLVTYQTHWHAEVAIVDHDGKVLCSSQNDSIITGRLDPNYLTDLFDSRLLEISEFKLDEHGQSVAFAGLRLPKGNDGAARAAITVIDLDEIQRRTEPVAQGMQYSVMVLGRDGIILAEHPKDPARLGTRLPGDHPLMPNVNMQIEGVTTGREADGSDRIFAFSQLPQTGAKIIIELARADALGAADKAISGMLIALAVVAVLAAGGAWLTAELSVLRWVAVLRNAAFAFARRDLDHRAIVPKRAGEFATLAKAFNGMAEIVAMRQHELEDRVAERTAALTEAQHELMKQERFSAIGQLAASVAHELRNPLGAAKNTVHTIHEIANTKQIDVARPIGRLERSLSRCERIIANLLDYVYVGEPKRRTVNFELWLGECLDGHALPAGIALVRDFAAPDAVIAIDAGRLHLVIANVIDNAMQAIMDFPDGQPTGTIKVATAIADGRLTLSIRDTGLGITAENLPHIFESLFSTRSFGMGLGLPTARKIVEQHAGTIAVTSELGEGTCVTIALPLAAGKSEDGRNESDRNANGADIIRAVA
ncbi:MAG TPA: ATP-binding protein [Stellaceae bacterium]|jgi:signal transduction histidine kinase|nr:ATP-binding protein [Stellaceae bacterium]